jgi:amino acid adenylation domain-containing protein
METVTSFKNFEPNPNVGITLLLSKTENKFALLNTIKKSKQQLQPYLENVGSHLNTLLSAISKLNAQQLKKTPIDHLPILTNHEYTLVTKKWNGPTTLTKHYTLAQLFEEQTVKTPTALAVVFGDNSITYEELNTQANQLGNYLISQGVKSKNVITILMESGINFIISILATIKINTIYLPISTSSPLSRIKYITTNSQSVHLLTQNSQKSTFETLDLELPITYIDTTIDNILKNLSAKNIQTKTSSQDNACIIYTSGSTGEPKGVILRHDAIINRIKKTNYVRFRSSDRVAQIANISFDATLFEVWGALLHGAQLHIIPKQITLIPKHFSKILHKLKISVLLITSSLFNQTLLLAPSAFDTIRQLFCGAEPCDINMMQKLLKRKNKKKLPIKIINAYGPTEITILALTHEITIKDTKMITVPIGKPVTNTHVFIADGKQQPLPIGVKGELYIGGLCVSGGYLNQPQTNKEKFLQFFLGKTKSIRVYQTGDIVRWLPNGTIEYIGREDDQIKVRGFRVELSEIKNRLCQYKGIETAILVPKKEKQNSSNQLIAYIVCNAKISVIKIRRFMLLHLPDYMVPTSFIRIKNIPLTANGKIAIDKLPSPETSHLRSHKNYAAPVDNQQKILQKFWSEVLHVNIKKMGIHDDFFLLGGHSLQAAKIVAKIYEKFPAKVNIADIFENPTIATLSEKLTLKIQNRIEEKTPKLKPANKKNNIPLSLAQKRIELIQNLIPDSPAYNIPRLLDIQGILDITKFSEALYQVIQRHDILRTNFVKKSHTTIQEIKTPKNLDHHIEIIDVKNFSEQAIKDCIYRVINTPFKLNTDPLLKVKIYQKSSRHFLALFCFHHIIFDGSSLKYFNQELSAFYQPEEKNSHAIKPLAIQYADFSIWQANLPYKLFFRPAENYWTQQLAGIKPLNLPTDHERPSLQTFRGKHIQFNIPTALSSDLQKLAKTKKSSLFSLFLSSFSILLYRHSTQQDFAIGIPITNRENALLTGMIGCFINTLPIRCNLHGDIPYTAYLNQIKKTLLEAYKYSEYSLEKILETLNIKYDPKFSPIFQVIFSFNEFEGSDLKLDNLKIKQLFANTDTAKVDLGIEIEVKEQKIVAQLEYNDDLFSNDTMQRFIAHFLTLLQSIVDNPETTINQLNILTLKENKNFAQWNKTKTNLAWHKPVYDLFLEQAKKSPKSIALQFDKNQLTYQALAQKVTSLSHHLYKLGVRKEEFIAISMHRSLEMVIALLAISKNGATFIPIDPDYPTARINYILSDSNSKIILVQDNLKHKFTGSAYKVISVDTLKNIDQPLIGQKMEVAEISPNDIAYVIYTSGSTGKPKGVLCTHKGLSNRLLWMQSAYKLTKKDTVLQKTTFCFDVSMWEFFWPLISGAKLLLAKPYLHKDPCYLLNTIIKENVTTIHFVPSMLKAYLEQKNIERCNNILKRVISSGETLTIQLREDFLKKLPSVKFYNLYGPTEASIDVTAWDCSQPLIYNKIPIGKPIANTELYVLDAYMNLVPINTPGELYIGGIGLARGYINNPELTHTKFIKNIFSKNPDADKLYKTGDLATWLPDGNLAFIDRVDNQVKVRGFRIDLSEIENALLKFPSISQCAAIVKGEELEKQIIAYITLKDKNTKKIQEKTIKEFLTSILPDYMIPALFIIIDEIPLTESGKIDKKRLLHTQGLVLRHKYVHHDPISSKQIIIARIFERILKISKISIDENFFDLGGSSITALNFLSKLNNKFSVNLTIQDLLDTPTIRGIENLIKKNKKTMPSYFKTDISPNKKERYLSISPIYPNKNKPILFLFHPIGGTIFWCLPLAKHLSPYYSVYAMQDPAIEIPNLNFKNLEDLVSFYVGEILKVQPSGPYLLAGFSSGANLAVEAAKQLFQAGKIVDFLGMIDGWAFYPQDIYNYDFFKMNLLKQFKETYDKLPTNTNYNWEKLFALQWERAKIYETYTPPKINHALSLFKAKNILPLYEKIDDPLNHWEKYTTEVIKTYWVPGDHESMLQEPNVKTLAESMVQAIQLLEKKC